MKTTPNFIASFLLSLVVVAFATTLILPGRQTSQVIGAGANGGATLIKSAIGQG